MDKSKSLLKQLLKLDLGPFLVVWITDRLSKTWATHLEGAREFGPIKLELVFNPGVFLGKLSTVPDEVRSIVLCTLAAILVSVYIFIRMIVSKRSGLLEVGLSMALAGILGNVSDRLLGYSGVVDFIALNSEYASQAVWNIADFFQLVGYMLIVSGLIKDGKSYWPKNDGRKSFYVLTDFQKRFAMKFLFVGISFGVVTSLMAYLFLRSSFKAMHIPEFQSGKILSTFIWSVGGLQLALILLALVGANYFSHRIAGPIFAIERFLREFRKNGSAGTFRLRSNDEFKQFEDILNNLSSEKDNNQ